MTNAPARPRRTPVRNSRRALLTAVAVGTLLVGILAVRLLQVHASTGDWRLTAAAAPSQLQYKNETYRKDIDATSSQRPIGMMSTGEFTAGGGEILVGLPIGESAAPALWLMVSTDNTYFSYLRSDADRR